MLHFWIRLREGLERTILTSISGFLFKNLVRNYGAECTEIIMWAGGQLTFKSGIFQKYPFVRIYLAECTEINMRASGACLNVKLWSAWRLAPDKGAQGTLHFGNGHENVFVSQTTSPIRTKFVRCIRVIRPCQFVFSVWIRLCKSPWGWGRRPF